jgi:hypothetical protein
MRILGLAMILMIAVAAFGVDVGESWRTGGISDGSAHAKRHHRKHHKKRARHKHHRHHDSAPATEM